MDELQHECGIAAIYHLPGGPPSRLAPLPGPEQVSRLMPRMLLDLQNRGQLAAGYATYNPRREKLPDTYKQIGTVIEAFRLNHQAKYESLMQQFAGRYNLVFLNAMGDMVVLRDPNGFRPLCVAQDGPLFAAASESVALLNLGFRQVRSLEPGELVLIQDGEVRFERFAPRRTPSH